MSHEEEEFEALDYIISCAAVGCTVVQFLSGSLVCKEYITKGTTGEASPLPFLSCIISSTLWFIYGALIDDNNIISINIIGITLMTIYSIIFFRYSPKKVFLRKLYLAALVLLSLITVFVLNTDDFDLLKTVIGLGASTFTLMTVAAPLSKLSHVMKVKSTECLPFPLIVMSFIVSSLWCLYGAMIADAFLIVPNFFGGVVTAVQLSLFKIYPPFATLPKYEEA